MWWKLGTLMLVTAGEIYALFFTPIATHAVRLDILGGSSAAQMQETEEMFSVAVPATILFAVLATSVWIAVRIIRSHRKPK